MLLENNPYPQDVRVRNEAEALVGAGHEVTVLAPRAEGRLARERVSGVLVRRYRLPVSDGGVRGFLLEYAGDHLQLFGRALWQLWRGADVVHLHNPPDTLFPVGLLARLLAARPCSTITTSSRSFWPTSSVPPVFGPSRRSPSGPASVRPIRFW